MNIKKRSLKNPFKSNTAKEFKKFITSKGNLIDLAVAVVIGAAFSAIVTSLVNDLLMPFISAAVGKSLSDLIWVANGVPAYLPSGAINPQAIIIKYGNFIQALINFLIIAVIMFSVVKAYMSIKNANKNKFYGFSVEEYYKLRKEGKTRKEIKKLSIENKERLEKEAELQKTEKEKNSVEGILKDIRTLLENQLNNNSIESKKQKDNSK